MDLAGSSLLFAFDRLLFCGIDLVGVMAFEWFVAQHLHTRNNGLLVQRAKKVCTLSRPASAPTNRACFSSALCNSASAWLSGIQRGKIALKVKQGVTAQSTQCLSNRQHRHEHHGSTHHNTKAKEGPPTTVLA